MVTTEDCYILEMHRIPFGKHSPIVAGQIRPAVLLMHGLLCSSADWVIPYPEKGLGKDCLHITKGVQMNNRQLMNIGYILADAGYDVWIGNFRGNTYSRNHCNMDPDKNDFWHFSLVLWCLRNAGLLHMPYVFRWDQMGKWDLPAMIDTVLLYTGLVLIFTF